MEKAVVRPARRRPSVVAARPPTKERILRAAEEVFATRGFEGASTREIAARSGINISSLHYHWETKERLYVAVFTDIDRRLMEASAASMRTGDGGPDGECRSREETIGRLFDFFRDNPTVPRLLLRRIVENEKVGREIERDVFGPSWRTFSDWVQELSGRRIPDSEAQLLMLTMHGALLLFALDGRQYAQVLGGSLGDGNVGDRVREHLVRLSGRLVATVPVVSE